MDLRQLDAFVAVATELHFGRAAAKLHIGQPTLSELVRRLERELGTPLLTRTTRRVALTSAGSELLARSKVILDDVAAAAAAVRRIAEGHGGTVRLGVTPPVAPVLAPHLIAQFARQAPDVTVEVHRMWLPTLVQAAADGRIDVAVTCAEVAETDGVVAEVFAAEPLLVGVRPGHRFAARTSVGLHELKADILGAPSESLFPAWSLAQQQVLRSAGMAPVTIPLDNTDLSAARWPEQAGPEWILLIPSLVSGTRADVILPVEPTRLVPYTLQWSPALAANAAVARFVRSILTADLPAGWYTGPGHLRHQAFPAEEPEAPAQPPLRSI